MYFCSFVRHSGQPFTRDFTPAALCLLPVKAEAGLLRLVSSLPEIQSMTQPDIIFIILTRVLRTHRSGENGRLAVISVHGIEAE
jgi:hypothetical protein